jgi:hypothetical protein
MPLPTPEEIKAGLKIVGEAAERIAPETTAAGKKFLEESLHNLEKAHPSISTALEHLPSMDVFEHPHGLHGLSEPTHLPVPAVAGFAGKHEPFEKVYMDWTKTSVEERLGAIAHLDKAPPSINKYLKESIIKSAIGPGNYYAPSVPNIKLIGATHIPTMEDLSEQSYAFSLAAPNVHRDLPTLKVLTSIVPKLHPTIQVDALKTLLDNPDLVGQLDEAFRAPIVAHGVTPEVESMLARTSNMTGLEHITSLVSDLPVEERRQIWDKAFGFTNLKDELARMPQEKRLQTWSEVEKLAPGQLAQNDTGFYLAQHWMDGLAKGDQTVKEAFEGFVVHPEPPPNLVRKSLEPTQFERFGEGSGDRVAEVGKETVWSDAELENALSQRLSRRALANSTPAKSWSEIESIASGIEASGVQITGKLQTLFPEIKFADKQVAIERLRSDANFQKLGAADKTDITMAVALTDASLPAVASQPGMSANLAHGLLASLDVNPVRAQRIASLVNAHDISLAAMDRGASVSWGTEPIRDLAAMTRSPQQGMKFETMMRAMHPEGESGDLVNAVHERAEVLSRDAVPVLTTEVPKGYGAVMLKGNFSFLSHISPVDVNVNRMNLGIGDHFISVLPKLETANSPISMALISPTNKRVYMLGDKHPSVAAIFSAAPENISQVGARDLHTHRWSDASWGQHLEDMEVAAQSPHAPKLLPDIMTGKYISSEELKGAWNDLTRFNSYDEAVGMGGDSAIRARSINDSLTAHITQAHQHSEVKAVDATLSGFAVQRNGENIAFEGMSEQEASDLFGGAKPSWVDEPSRYGDWNSDTMQVPKSVWQEAMKRNIPFVFID